MKPGRKIKPPFRFVWTSDRFDTSMIHLATFEQSVRRLAHTLFLHVASDERKNTCQQYPGT